ncbi:MAG: alkaline phosphatase family protein [Rikenellaceae bacterium]
MNKAVKVLFAAVAMLVAGTATSFGKSSTANPPRLVVNIVVGSMRLADLERYSSNFASIGLARVGNEGMVFTNASYNHSTASTATSLATLTTGANPALHGVIGDSWYDYTTSKSVSLTMDPTAKNMNYSIDDSGHSPLNLLAPTLTDALLRENEASKSMTIALDPTSAVVMNGKVGEAVWFDPFSCEWATSTAYGYELPQWVADYNEANPRSKDSLVKWVPVKKPEQYKNSTTFGLVGRANDSHEDVELSAEVRSVWGKYEVYDNVAFTPLGNTMTLDLAWQAIRALDMGKDEVPDVVNISLDAARYITSRYGTNSVEAEDMYYHLDRDFAQFVAKVYTWVRNKDVVIVLTSDHGTAPQYDEEKLFNPMQFRTLLNAFLGAKYGSAEWVLGYENNSIYLNHDHIYSKKRNLEQIQDEAAAFALQFRGVSHALTATTLRKTHFADGYGQKLQNSYYPRRSGDVMISLMPGWVEEHLNTRSLSGSIYRYDTHVPVIFLGSKISAKRITRPIDMTDVAPTLASILNIEMPAVAEGEIIAELDGVREQ